MAEESFFEKEKDRLLKEIATGMEDLISTTNAYNRKMEEAYGVGREFSTVADLWGKFVADVTGHKVERPEGPGCPRNRRDDVWRGREMIMSFPSSHQPPNKA
ncbi:uncharacterized protein CcaverHIS019_0104300 [Cutaneotrichosporon cavernicola]|uniref:DASH complex subunit DAD1 n=1 Tax=Cutaneotrichosporon cavernicola TaxID=279322 RepID=A0AA48L0L3_9TREE|nr:uncharacterized protein CcaverHIS019_0104300 [Cutaneotrichosporon cavernicola]BEI87712.1 hypothetical protein CcaverHIS019_0104300 [Cutaneotrichosporon cavernicola]BEI95483.1 hypothetical protein CcaverHIS631_0104320 [Cutaneotrichosporon cavernicola]BEJ03257.1 hypothetical protein CcaverHIS641_0104320 [Cutaneotrichosporon cavernicola]